MDPLSFGVSMAYTPDSLWATRRKGQSWVVLTLYGQTVLIVLLGEAQ
jgi:hypothetical protein